MSGMTILEGNMSDAVGRRSLAVNGRYIRGYGVPKYRNDKERAAVISAARSFLGCKEADGTFRKVIDLYNSHTPLARGYRLSYDDPWCAGYASAVAIAAKLTDIIPTEVSCDRMIALFKQRGAWVEDDSYTPKPGDYIFYDWQDDGVGDNVGGSDHVGIVETSPIELDLDGAEEAPASDPEPAAGYEAEGIDVSVWQGDNIDFEKVKASGKKFVIIRAGYRQTVDKHWEENYRKAKAAGLAVGAYWFQYAANVTSSQKEAAACIKALSGKQLELPVYYDLEPDGDKTPPTSQYNANAYAFCQKLEAAGYFTGIYTSESFLQYFDAAFKERFTLWVANWSRKPALGAVWQKSSKGSVPGISGDVDLDVCYQDFPTIIKKARLNGFGDDAPAPDPEPTPAPAPDPEPETTVDGTVMDLATRVIQGDFGVGAERRARLGNRYDEVQGEVNHRLTASVETVAREVIAGRYGNGEDRKRALGYRYGAVPARVNSILR